MYLRDGLNKYPYKTLMVIAQHWRLEKLRHIKKNQLVARLAQTLLHHENLNTLFSQLTLNARSAIQALIVADGSLPFELFRQHFGEIRPYQLSHSERTLSTAEELAYLGLIFRLPRKPKPGEKQEIIIPSDLLEKLSSLPLFTSLEKHTDLAPHGDAILNDVIALLEFIQRQEVSAIHHGRWFSLNNLRALNKLFTTPEDFQNVRGELQSTLPRFIHFLAASAELIEVVDDTFTLSKTGREWLSESPESQLRQLWDAWRLNSTSQGIRWERFRYPLPPEMSIHIPPHMIKPDASPSYRLPSAPPEHAPYLISRILKHLANEAIGVPIECHTFYKTIWQKERAFWAFDVPVEEAVARNWFSFHDVAPDGWIVVGDVKPTLWPDFNKEPWNDEKRRRHLIPPEVQDFVDKALTTLLTWWGVVQFQDSDHFMLTPFANWLLHNKPSSAATLSMPSPEHKPPPQPHAQPTQIRLTHATLLEATSPDLMTSITRHRNVSKHIMRTLSRRTIMIDESEANKIARHLEREGYNLTNTLPSTTRKRRGAYSKSDATILLTAAHVYRALAQWLELPQPLPDAALRPLTNTLPPASQSAALDAAESTIERLTQLIDGWSGPSHPEKATLPQKKSLSIIEEALNNRHLLKLTYWSAGRGVRTSRTVEPYRLEWRGPIAYLVAFCQHAQDERRFRVSRIEAIELGAEIEDEEEWIDEWWQK